MRKRWSRWWRSSSAPSLTGPPSNSGDDMVDLMRESEFFLHSLAEGESKEEEEACKRGNREGRRRSWRWRLGWAWTRGGGTWHLLCRGDTHTSASRGQSPVKERTIQRTKHATFWFCTETSRFAPTFKTDLPSFQKSRKFLCCY